MERQWHVSGPQGTPDSMLPTCYSHLLCTHPLLPCAPLYPALPCPVASGGGTRPHPTRRSGSSGVTRAEAPSITPSPCVSGGVCQAPTESVIKHKAPSWRPQALCHAPVHPAGEAPTLACTRPCIRPPPDPTWPTAHIPHVPRAAIASP